MTAGSLPARMAVEHCVHEARGLDVLPATIAKFVNGGDAETAALLEGTIYPEEAGADERRADAVTVCLCVFPCAWTCSMRTVYARILCHPLQVSHCAAGVRWLRHLHQVAHAQGKQGEQGKLGAVKPDPTEPEVCVNNQGKGQAPSIAGAQPADAAVCCSGEEGQAVTQAAGKSESGVWGQGGDGPCPAWMEEARQHAQVGGD